VLNLSKSDIPCGDVVIFNLQDGGQHHLGLSKCQTFSNQSGWQDISVPSFIKIGQMAANLLQLTVFETAFNCHLAVLKYG